MGGPVGLVRQLLPVLVLGLVMLAAGTAAQWADDPWYAHVVAGMAAGALLGLLLVRKPASWWIAAHGAVAWAALAGGALLAGGGSVAAVIDTAVPVLGALVAYGVLRANGIDATGLRELTPFARTLAIGMLLPPLGYALLTASGLLAPAGSGFVDLVARLSLAGALGVLATLPLMLCWSGGENSSAEVESVVEHSERRLLAVMAWLPIGASLWWQPQWLVLASLPLVAAAARIGPRATAWLGLATGVAIAVPGMLPGVVASRTLELATLSACAALLAAITFAILAEQRDRAGDALSAAQDQLLAITERGPTLVATLDRDGRHDFASRRYLLWLRMDRAQVVGQSLPDVYGEAATAMTAPLRAALSGQPRRVQVALADGRALDVHFMPRFSAEGPVDGIHLLAQDVGWRSMQERNLEALLAAAPAPTAVLDTAGLVIRLNDKLVALLGVTREALLGKSLATWLKPPADAAMNGALARLRDDRKPRQLPRALDLHALRSDGSAVPVELHLAPMEGGRGMAVVVLHDLGPQLAAEQLLAQSRGQSELVLHALGDAVLACGLDERITLFNPAAARMLAWSQASALGQPLADVVRFSDPDDGAVLPSALRDAMRRDVAIHSQTQTSLLRRDGSHVMVAQSATPIRNAFGQVTGGVLALHDVSQSQAQTQTLAHQALHDHLTGLPNRVLFQDRLSQALAQAERGSKGALLYLDLDHFKPINDRLGHPVGDRVLQEVASRLRAGVRDDDTVSRQGGDEFVLLLVRLADPRDAARVAGKLIHAIEAPVHIDGHELSISASIGIALFPQDGRDIHALTKQADAALYHAKQGGRGRYSYFTDIMSASAEQRMRTEHDLRIALANGDFALAWQPQVQVPQRDVIGVEALVRWRRPDGAVLLPDDFIPVAEETGLVVQIDEWVLREACRQNVRWQQQGLPPLPVSVNVSLARFDAARLLAHVDAVLLETGLQPRWLEIEFKAAQLFAQGARGQALVAALKAQGVRVAADDFGSGQASLEALTHYAFDTLKIDRGFVQHVVDDAQSQAVVKVMLAIGHAMGYRVIAKGVETTAQHDALARLGCTAMQGLLLGEAAASERFAALVGQGAATLPAVL